MLVDVFRRLQGRCIQCGGAGYFYHLPDGGSSTRARLQRMGRLKVRCHCGVGKISSEDLARFRAMEGTLWDRMFREHREPK